MNIIADKVSLSGTVRSFSQETQSKMVKRIEDMARGIETMYHCKIEIKFVDMYPPVINNEGLFNEIWPMCDQNGEKKLFKKVMLSEDFAMYKKAVPSVFIGLGCYNKEKGFIENLHTHGFNFNERVLLRGLDLYITILTKEQKYIS